MSGSVLPLDNFLVINKSFLNDSDRLILSLLYQPIVGNVAIGFYLTLWGLLNENDILSNSHSHNELVSSMQLKLEDIVEAREKLEAIGLIKTYFKKENNEYVYELYAPISVSEFLNNPVLEIALYNNVGKKKYEQIIKRFELPTIDLTPYKDISKTFKEVFTFVASETNGNNIRSPKHLDLSIEATINFNDVLALIPEELLNYKSLTKDIRNIIYQLAFIYDLDSMTMSEIIKNSINEKKIDIELLKDNCRNFYKFETKGKMPNISYLNQPLHLRKENTSDSNKDKLIRQFEQISPRDFLSYKNGGNSPTTNDSKIIEYLMLDLKLNPGVVNVLIDYVLKINNNKLVKPFVEQIANQWVRSNIKTVEDAIEFAKNEYGNKKTKTKKTIEKAPKWLDKSIESERMSEEELKAFEEELNND